MTTSLPPDPYKTLGVAQDAQIPEIRSAHRKLVLKCHPDKVQDPTLKAQKQDEFQKVQQAYELLSNEKERQRYDDQARLAELRRQMQAKANSSAPRTTQTYNFADRTPESRPSSFKSSSGTPPSAKYGGAFPRSYEDPSGARIFEHIPVRREKSYESKSKREERDRERAAEKERDRDRERERERERRKKAEKMSEDYARRAEEEAKKARKAEKKARDKDRKRDTEEKKRHAKPYIEEYMEEPPRSEKRKSGKKHEEKRDRSTHRDEVPMSPVPPPPMPVLPPKDDVQVKVETAAAYIQSKNPAAFRQFANPPAAPTPPMPAGQSSPFTPPAADDDDVRRSSAKSRRGSANKRPSRETVLQDPDVINVSPSAHKASKAATAAAALSGSPPRREFARQNTMPDAYSRPMPSMARASTFNGVYPDAPRGRDRSRLQPQVSVESDLDGGYEPRHSRKHRSKKHRSPEPRQSEYVRSYKVETGRAVLQEEYSRSFEPANTFTYYPPNHGHVRVVESREPRESGHRSSANDYDDVPFKVKTSRTYGVDDVNYSVHYPTPAYDEYQYAY